MPIINKEDAVKRAEKRQAMLGLYSPKEIAELFGFDTRTMAIWRSKKVGPRYTKLGKNVYYRLDDIHSWVQENIYETSSTSQDDEKQFDMFPPCDCCKAEETTTQFATSEGSFNIPTYVEKTHG